jgi:hypothetical protein
MVRGRFRMFEHDHYFEEVRPGSTRMRDVLVFQSRLGPLGWVVDVVVMSRYLKHLLVQRNEVIKAAAEAHLRVHNSESAAQQSVEPDEGS